MLTYSRKSRRWKEGDGLLCRGYKRAARTRMRLPLVDSSPWFPVRGWFVEDSVRIIDELSSFCYRLQVMLRVVHFISRNHYSRRICFLTSTLSCEVRESSQVERILLAFIHCSAAAVALPVNSNRTCRTVKCSY